LIIWYSFCFSLCPSKYPWIPLSIIHTCIHVCNPWYMCANSVTASSFVFMCVFIYSFTNKNIFYVFDKGWDIENLFCVWYHFEAEQKDFVKKKKKKKKKKQSPFTCQNCYLPSIMTGDPNLQNWLTSDFSNIIIYCNFSLFIPNSSCLQLIPDLINILQQMQKL
jgi:hypothetical protein